MKMLPPPDLDVLRSALSYDPETGVFIWKRPGRRKRAGEVAGRVGPDGYRRIRLDNVEYAAHRLAVYTMTSEWPPNLVDHKNHARDDNRFVNLRCVTSAENLHNQVLVGRGNSTGLIGVYKEGRRFRAEILAYGRKHRLGAFDTAEDAHRAYLSAKATLHPTFAEAV